jgi:hypothetical protein
MQLEMEKICLQKMMDQGQVNTMNPHKYSEKELKLTAVIYATRKDVVDYVQFHGKLPATIPLGGFPTALNFLSRKRGFSPILSEGGTTGLRCDPPRKTLASWRGDHYSRWNRVLFNGSQSRDRGLPSLTNGGLGRLKMNFM